jgi:hypothetical protein
MAVGAGVSVAGGADVDDGPVVGVNPTPEVAVGVGVGVDEAEGGEERVGEDGGESIGSPEVVMSDKRRVPVGVGLATAAAGAKVGTSVPCAKIPIAAIVPATAVSTSPGETTVPAPGALAVARA